VSHSLKREVGEKGGLRHGYLRGNGETYSNIGADYLTKLNL